MVFFVHCVACTLSNSVTPCFLIAGYNRSVDIETIGDVRQLCVIFEHVEKLLTLAASLHRKFLKAPRLSESIFSDFYNFYLPKMGTGSMSSNLEKVNFIFLIISLVWEALLSTLVYQISQQ